MNHFMHKIVLKITPNFDVYIERSCQCRMAHEKGRECYAGFTRCQFIEHDKPCKYSRWKDKPIDNFD